MRAESGLPTITEMHAKSLRYAYACAESHWMAIGHLEKGAPLGVGTFLDQIQTVVDALASGEVGLTRKPGTKPERLKIDMPLNEALQTMFKAGRKAES